MPHSKQRVPLPRLERGESEREAKYVTA